MWLPLSWGVSSWIFRPPCSSGTRVTDFPGGPPTAGIDLPGGGGAFWGGGPATGCCRGGRGGAPEGENRLAGVGGVLLGGGHDDGLLQGSAGGRLEVDITAVDRLDRVRADSQRGREGGSAIDQGCTAELPVAVEENDEAAGR